MYILFFRCSFVQKKNKTWYFRPIFREKPLFPPGYIKSPANSKSQWCDLGEHWTLKSIVQKSSRIQRSLLEYSPRYSLVSLKSLWNPTYFLESYIYFGIPKKNRIRNPSFQFWNPISFFGWNPMESDAFYLWNPMESWRFFLESQGIYTSLVGEMPQ